MHSIRVNLVSDVIKRKIPLTTLLLFLNLISWYLFVGLIYSFSILSQPISNYNISLTATHVKSLLKLLQKNKPFSCSAQQAQSQPIAKLSQPHPKRQLLP